MPKQPAQNLTKSDSTKKPNTITKNPGTNYYPLVTKGAVPQTVIEPTNQSQTTQEKRRENQGNHPVPQPGKLLDHDPKASSQRKKRSGVVAT